MILATGQTLEIVLAGAVAANQCPAVIDYVDVLGTDLTPGSSAALTNSTTPVTICAAPTGSTKRKINLVSVVNIDTAAITATVRVNTGSTYDIVKITIPVGGTLTFNDRTGWRVVTQFGGTPDLRAGWVQEFRADGTWYKPSGARFFMVECVGGGGGGGAGVGMQSGVTYVAGGGGGGASRTRRFFLASDLPASVAVTVAAQAAGGVPVTNGYGGSGGNGGNSSFGSYLVGYGGGGGAGASNAGTGGGGGAGWTGAGSAGTRQGNGNGGQAMLYDYAQITGYMGGLGTYNSPGYSSFLGGAGSGYAGPAASSWFSAGGGGPGGWVQSSAGNVGYQPGSSGFGPVPPAALVGGRGSPGLRTPGFVGTGGGGGGGFFTSGTGANAVAGDGGDGGYPGGGGGGGGTAVATGGGNAIPGAGGKGGAGMVRVMGW